MSRSALSLFLALALFVGFAGTAKGDVTGSFDIDISLLPQTTAFEAVEFDIDLQANLVVNVTLSGLTFGADLGFGVTGVEFAILSLTTNLGALSVFDQFVFAAPFGCDEFPTGDGDNTSGGIPGQCRGDFVGPIGIDSTTDPVSTNVIGFVKKRVDMELNIAGITLNNLAILEDVDFPDIDGRGDHEHDHFLTSNTYDLGQTNNTIDDEIPTFGFGDVITLSGQTVSGISVTNITGICADAQEVNRIKKRSFAGEVDNACAGDSDVIDGTSEALLAFTVEKIGIEGVEIGGILIDSWFEFRPGEPFSADFTLAFSVAGLANVTVSAESDNITNLTLNSITTVVSADNLTLTLSDIGGNLKIDQVNAVFSVTLNPNQNPASLTVSVTTSDPGLTALSATLTVSRSGLTLSSATSFSGSGTLQWSSTSFNLSAEAGALNFGARLSYGPGGFGGGALNFGIVF